MAGLQGAGGWAGRGCCSSKASAVASPPGPDGSARRLTPQAAADTCRGGLSCSRAVCAGGRGATRVIGWVEMGESRPGLGYGGLPGSTRLYNYNTLLPCAHVDVDIRKYHVIRSSNVPRCPGETWVSRLVQPPPTGGPRPQFPGYSSEFGGLEPAGRLGGQLPNETPHSPAPRRGHSCQSSRLSLHSGAFWGPAGGCP